MKAKEVKKESQIAAHACSNISEICLRTTKFLLSSASLNWEGGQIKKQFKH
jgi:hypothetical protein